MLLGKVVGTVVAPQKDPQLEGLKLLVVRAVNLDMQVKDSYVVAMDGVGAGLGELVVCVGGSSARMTEKSQNRPIDTLIVGIVDQVEVEGRIVYTAEGQG